MNRETSQKQTLVSRKESWNPRFSPSYAKEIPDRSVFCICAAKQRRLMRPWIVFLLGLFVAGVIFFIVHTNSDALRGKTPQTLRVGGCSGCPCGSVSSRHRPLVAGQLIVKQGSDMNMRAASAGVMVLSEVGPLQAPSPERFLRSDNLALQLR